jgi:hypothetical protein
MFLRWNVSQAIFNAFWHVDPRITFVESRMRTFYTLGACSVCFRGLNANYSLEAFRERE